MKPILFTLLLSVFFILHSSAFNSVASISIPVAKETTVEPTAKKEQIKSFRSIRKSVEKKLGRKLKLSERIGLWYYTQQPRYDKEYQRKTNNQALTGFILSVCSLVIFPILAIPGLILSSSALRREKIDPGLLEGGNKGLAKAGQILGIIGLLYFFLLVIYIAALIGIGTYGY